MLAVRRFHPPALAREAGALDGRRIEAIAAIGRLAGELLDSTRPRAAMARTVRWAREVGFRRSMGLLDGGAARGLVVVAAGGLAGHRAAMGSAATDVARCAAGAMHPVAAGGRALAEAGFVAPVAIPIRARQRGRVLGFLVVDLAGMRGGHALAGVAALDVAGRFLGRCLATSATRDEATRRLLERRRRPASSPGDPRALAGLAHELRTPLNAVVAFSQAIRAGIYGPVTPGQGRALDRVAANARALDLIVEGFLAGAGAATPGPRRIVRLDAAAVVAETVRQARAVDVRGRSLRLGRHGKVPRIEADKGALRLVVAALVKAALATMVGPIRVDVRHDAAADAVTVTCRGRPGPPAGAVALARCRGLAAALGAQIHAAVAPPRAEVGIRMPRRFYPIG